MHSSVFTPPAQMEDQAALAQGSAQQFPITFFFAMKNSEKKNYIQRKTYTRVCILGVEMIKLKRLKK